MQQLGPIAKLLVVVGALNWGLVGVGFFFNQDLNIVGLLVGTWPVVEAIVYILVGLSAIYLLVNAKK